MAKKKKGNSRNRREHRPQHNVIINSIHSKEIVSDSEIILMTITKYFGSAIMVTAILNYFYGPWSQSIITIQIPSWLNITCTALLSLLVTLHILLTRSLAGQGEYLLKALPIMGADVEKYKKYRKLTNIQFLLAILISSTIVLPYLYIYGFATQIYDLLVNRFPNIRESVARTLSALVTFTTSILIPGIICNFIYDLLKYFVIRKTKK